MKLTCFAGLPGSGKTYAATILERKTGATRISRDEVRAQLFRPPAYTDSEKTASYSAMLEVAENHLLQGKDVILEGMPFSKKAERDSARALAERVGAEFEIIHCWCSDEEALRRIAAQAEEHLAADRSEDLYYRSKARFEPFGEDENITHLQTDTA